MGRKKMTAAEIADRVRIKSTLDQSSFLAAVIEEFHGPRELARAMKLEYDQAKAGTMIRQKILFMIQYLIISTTQRELTNAPDWSRASTEDLEKQFDRMAKRVAEHAASEKEAADPGAAGAEGAAEVLEVHGGPDPGPGPDEPAPGGSG